MGKLALWVLVAVVVMLLVRMLGTGKRNARVDRDGPDGTASKGGESKEAERRGNAGELMMGCAICGVHIPSSDAVFAGGRVYCGAEHRDQDEAGRRQGTQSRRSRQGTQSRQARDGEGKG